MAYIHLSPFTPILIQYARVAGRNEWIGTVTLRIFDAKRCKRRLIYKGDLSVKSNSYLITLKDADPVAKQGSVFEI